MQSAHAMAINEINETRSANSAELERRRDEIRQKAPRYSGIETELRQAGNALLRSVLSGTRDFEKIKGYIQSRQREKESILTSLGLPKDYLDEIYSCPLCRDTGFDDNGKKCACLKALTAKYIDYNSNMTGIMKNQTFESFDFSLFSPHAGEKKISPLDHAKKLCDAARDFAESIDADGPAGVMVRGGVGTGKTYICSCIGNRVLSLGKTVYYQTAYKLCELMEDLRFNKSESEEQYENLLSIQRYAEDTDLLIIDDLGTEFLTSFTAAALFDLVNTRLLRGRKTVISTNLDFKTMEERYSPRLTSRILGEYRILSTAPGDLRKKRLDLE